MKMRNTQPQLLLHNLSTSFRILIHQGVRRTLREKSLPHTLKEISRSRRRTRNDIVNIFRLTLLLLFIHSIFVVSQSAIEKDADAIYLDITHEYILHPDGSTTYNYEHHLKFLTSYAVNRQYGESFVVYNPKWQTLKITKSITTMADGQKVESPFNAFNEVLPGFAAAAAPYTHLREMVVTHTGLEKNAVVNFAYSITTKPGMFPGLMGKVMFGDRSPIQKITVKIKIPQKQQLIYESINGEQLKPSSTEQNIYTWTKENIPLVVVESSQPPMDQFVPSLYFSTARYEQIIEHILGDENKLYVLSSKVKAVVKDITKDAKTSLDKALAIRSYVENNVALMNCDLSYLGHKAMTAQDVFDKNVGSQLDKSILLTAMCKSVGIDAVPCLSAVFTTFKPDQLQSREVKNNVSVYSYSMSMQPDVPSQQLFNTAVVMCKNILENNSPLYLDPNYPQNGIVNLRLLEKFILPLSKSKVEKTTVAVNPESNSLTTTSDWILKNDGTFSGKTSATASGIFNYAFQKDRFVSAAKRSLEKSGQGCVLKEDESNATNDIASCTISVDSKSPLQSVGDIIRFTLPSAPGGLNDMHIGVSTALRTTPIDLPAAFKEECNFHLHLPKNVSVAFYPESMRLQDKENKVHITTKNSVGEVEIKIIPGEDDVEVTKRINFYTNRIEPEKYRDFFNLVSTWQDPLYQSLILSMITK